MQLFIQGNANLKQMKAEFAALTAQVEAFNTQLAESTMMPVGGSPAGYKRATRAAGEATRAYQNALASSGAYRIETIKVNDAIEKQTDLLQRNKLGFNKTFGKKNRDMMRAIYREQLALNQATAQAHRGLVGDGKTRVTMAIPTEVHKSWDTLNNRIGMFRHQLDSASSELVNWGKNTQWAGRQLMVGFTMPVAAFGAAAGIMAYQADKQLTRISKVYDTTANANSSALKDQMAVEAELNALREAGIETSRKAAKEYGAAMTDTLDVQAELAATGVTGLRLQESTAEVMRVAALGEIDRTVATKAMIAMQSTLNATTKETADIFNYMNSIENATSLATADFAEAIPRALGPMKEMSREGATSVEVMQNLSLLMVAMKERGIEAGEGANAIKAMMQRLYRPSKQVRQEWTQLAGVDPLKFVEETGGDVMKILPKISAAVADVDKATKIKLLAGLFGTYQVTRMSAMLKGFENLENGVGQVGRVMETNRQTMQDWGDTADRELKKMQESVSGRFMRSWRTLQVELAAIGEPFLEVATYAVKAAGALVGLFNAMPGWAKKTVIFGAIMAAIVGPVVMLVGLFANFAGNIGKFVAWGMRAITTFKLMDKATWAAKTSAELAARGFTTQASAAEIAENQTRALTFALREYATTMAQLAHLPPPKFSSLTPAPVDLGVQHGPERPTHAQRAYLLAQQRGKHKDMSPLVAQQKVTEKISKNMSSSAASTGLMLAGMTAMIWPSGEVVNNIGMAAMTIGAMAGPLSGLGSGIKTGALRAKEMATGFYSAKKEALAGAKHTGKLAGKAGLASAATKGLLTGFMAMMGPVGWIMTAVTLIGGGLYIWSQHQKKIREEQEATQKALSNATENWASEAGKVVRQFKIIQQTSILPKAGTSKKTMQQRVEPYTGEGPLRALADEVGDLEGQRRRNFLTSQFIDLQNRLGLSANEAAQEIMAMLIASGEGFADADMEANNLLRTLGEFSQEDLKIQIDALIDNIDPSTDKTLKDSAKDVAQAWGEAFANADTPEEAREIFKKIEDLSKTHFDDMVSYLSEHGKKQFEKAGVTDIKTYIEALQSGDLRMGQTSFIAGMDDEFANAASSGTALEKAIVSAIAETQGLSGEFEFINDLLDNTVIKSKTMDFKQAKKEVNLIKNAVMAMNGEKPGLVGLGGGKNAMDNFKNFDEAHLALKGISKETAMAKINTINIANGFKEGKTYGEALRNFTLQIDADTGKAAKNVDKVKNGLRDASRISFSAQEVTGMMQTGMAGVQEDISNMLNEDFESSLERATENHQNYWDAAVERMEKSQEAATARQEAQHERAANKMERRHENEMERFERRWEARAERVEDAYDKRIKATEKAIEAEQKAEEIRQKIFEAEKTRLDRLTESANRTIDFNLALQTGELDEAAKIRNDMDAAAQEWALSDAGADGATRSERRIRRLERRAERIGERKNEALEALEKTEEAQRKSLERQQEAQKKALDKQQEQEKKHLQKVQEMRRDALDDQIDNAKKAFDREWDIRRDSLDRQLDTFKSFVPKNQKQLEKWMDKMDITYEKFGNKTLDPKSEKWGRWFENSLTRHIRQAGREIRSDQMWEKLGKNSAKMTLRGMGFSGMGSFTKFIKTGKLPENFGDLPPLKGKRGGKRGGRNNTRQPGDRRNENTGLGAVMHTGGVVGGVGSGSRKGVARNLKGLHSSEQMIKAQKGEFIVNRDSAKKHSGLLDAVNKGIFDNKAGVLGGSGMVPGFTAFIAAALNRGFAQGVAQSLINLHDTKQAEFASAGTFGKISPGQYGDSSFTAEQLKNARIIADVGRSLGASSRDIIIALMTAMQESTLRNLDWGDRDSVGLFQQRDAWGSFAARTNPAEAARMFFLGGAQGQRGLFDFPDRNSMSLTQAAQAVQVSAYPDAYARWADEARAIYRALRSSSTSGGGYVPGPGGRHRPVRGYGYGSIHGTETGYPAVDFAMPTGKPVYAVADGTVTRSYDITGYEPRAPHGGLGYRSYGRVVYLKTEGGPEVLYAHLSKRSVTAGQKVSGGAVLGYSGNTGHSFGPHLHFGATNGPLAWLKTGGMTLNDGMAMLHRGETVLTKPLTEDLQRTVRAFGAASKEKLSGKNRRRRIRSYDPTEKNMWGEETTPVTGMGGGGWTYTTGMKLLKTVAKIESAATKDITDTGAKATIRIGTLNTKVGTAAAKTQKDLKRLIPDSDFLALTEMAGKFGAIKKFLASRNWGLLGGRGTDQKRAALAYNKSTQKLEKKGVHLLGKKRGNFVGGREDRWANYGLFTDRKTGRKTWQVSAHTVPTPRMDARHRELFMQQWGNLDALVNRLSGTGSPVFVAGDLNNNPNRNWWRTPAGLKSYRGRGVDWIFADPKLTDVVRSSFMGRMHTDHGGAVLADYHIPSRKDGAQNIRWDNTLVNMHKKESILTADQSDRFRWLADNIDKVATGGGNQYNINIEGANASPDEIARKVIKSIERQEARKPVRRRS